MKEQKEDEGMQLKEATSAKNNDNKKQPTDEATATVAMNDKEDKSAKEQINRLDLIMLVWGFAILSSMGFGYYSMGISFIHTTYCIGICIFSIITFPFFIKSKTELGCFFTFLLFIGFVRFIGWIFSNGILGTIVLCRKAIIIAYKNPFYIGIGLITTGLFFVAVYAYVCWLKDRIDEK